MVVYISTVVGDLGVGTACDRLRRAPGLIPAGVDKPGVLALRGRRVSA